MKSWTKDIVIEVPIEQVWNLLNGSLEDMQKIMPAVVAHEPVKLTDEKIGSIYLQRYREGNREQEYEVQTLDYINDDFFKKLKVGFTLAKLFKITAEYELKSIETNKTNFRYTTTNTPLKWFLKPLVKFASDKVVVQFVERVKKEAEQQALQSSGQL
ncbi:SRPBCC family protein [Ureibacillus chungkukjangi]|uniref:Polyketide cyclase/dehydrase/lipid transport protein n=1 Tax=Ureibacillus chungkukjangi TaxID=1202712 RepID=A0A318TR07_9BACL|nr:SRPBCC family protein [Ureibacillus chungkukjangi]MCM3390070.1 SRPBCC family protein [Ureibacillus chungkukjangi]PYF07262.1 polyketide cyclase/dehydrase/lipid transport protein [Ureibacillus chungkukjangi]